MQNQHIYKNGREKEVIKKIKKKKNLKYYSQSNKVNTYVYVLKK